MTKKECLKYAKVDFELGHDQSMWVWLLLWIDDTITNG